MGINGRIPWRRGRDGCHTVRVVQATLSDTAFATAACPEVFALPYYKAKVFPIDCVTRSSSGDMMGIPFFGKSPVFRVMRYSGSMWKYKRRPVAVLPTPTVERHSRKKEPFWLGHRAVYWYRKIVSQCVFVTKGICCQRFVVDVFRQLDKAGCSPSERRGL